MVKMWSKRPLRYTKLLNGRDGKVGLHHAARKMKVCSVISLSMCAKRGISSFCYFVPVKPLMLFYRFYEIMKKPNSPYFYLELGLWSSSQSHLKYGISFSIE